MPRERCIREHGRWKWTGASSLLTGAARGFGASAWSTGDVLGKFRERDAEDTASKIPVSFGRIVSRLRDEGGHGEGGGPGLDGKGQDRDGRHIHHGGGSLNGDDGASI